MPIRLDLTYNTGGIMRMTILTAISTGCYFALFIAFMLITGTYEFYAKGALINSLASALFFSLPLLFLPRRVRLIVPVMMIIITVFLFCQYLHYLTFNDFFTGDAMFASDLTDKTFIDSARSLISVKSLSLFVPAIVMISAFILLRKDLSIRVSTRVKVIALVLFLLQPAAIYAGSLRRLYLWYNTDGTLSWHEAYMQQQLILNYPDTAYQLTQYLGPGFLCWHFCATITSSEISLTPEERESLAERVSSTADSCSKAGIGGDKSLILIFVESLNSSILQLPESAEILPTLTSLLADSGTVSARNVLTQVSHGESSDGQFIVTTGLLPFRNGAFVSHFSDADYPSLPKALGYDSSAEVICESANIWQHSVTTKSYGYGKLYDYSVDDNRPDHDAQVLERAACVTDSLTPPYMLMVSTIGMHMPYLKSIDVSQPLDISGPEWEKYDNRCLNYMIATHEFDRALGVFLDSVQAKSLRAGTPLPVIAIVGDHATPRNSLTAPLHSQYVPLIVCNTGRKLDYSAAIGQVDVFPTLLDIMGVESYILPSTGRPYRGLGASILSDSPPVGAVDPEGNAVEGTEQAGLKASMWQLSDSLIRSRFFKPGH